METYLFGPLSNFDHPITTTRMSTQKIQTPSSTTRNLIHPLPETLGGERVEARIVGQSEPD